ncbi:hypothetical protein, partial [Acidiphilium sp.]|uniref:hypothetical protein n=1 Tax=Acidiphilium sp. TaxID=527 RepID=UPI003CFE4810
PSSPQSASPPLPGCSANDRYRVLAMKKYGLILHNTVRYLPFLLPLLWLPLLVEYLLDIMEPHIIVSYDTTIFGFDLIYIFAVRFFVLDLILYFVTRNDRTARFALLEIVFLYIEITLITVTYFGFLYNLFGVFHLFRYTGPNHTLVHSIIKHTLLLSMYISIQNFTTLGLGDWLPKELSSMISVSIEAILGFIQAGVFVAIVITAHQSRLNHG